MSGEKIDTPSYSQFSLLGRAPMSNKMNTLFTSPRPLRPLKFIQAGVKSEVPGDAVIIEAVNQEPSTSMLNKSRARGNRYSERGNW